MFQYSARLPVNDFAVVMPRQGMWGCSFCIILGQGLVDDLIIVTIQTSNSTTIDASVLLPGEDFEAFFLLCDGQHTPSDLPQLRTGNQGRVLGASSSAPRREVKTLWCSRGVRLVACDTKSSRAQKISLFKSLLLCYTLLVDMVCLFPHLN